MNSLRVGFRCSGDGVGGKHRGDEGDDSQLKVEGEYGERDRCAFTRRMGSGTTHEGERNKREAEVVD